MLIDLRPLKHREFLFFYFGQGISQFGSMITSVVLPYQIYSLTKSTLLVGSLSLVQLIPLLVTGLIGGVFSDKFSRKKLMITAESLLVLCSALLIWNATLSQPKIWLLFAMGALMSSINGFHRPSQQALVPRLVPKEEITAVSALMSLKSNIAMIGGPALGGFLMAKFGSAFSYGVDLATFLLSLFALSQLSSKPVADPVKEPVWKSLKIGLRYASSRQELIGTYVVDIVAMLFGMPSALFPAIAENFGGAKVVGMFYAAPSAGALLLSLTSGWTKNIHRHGLAVIISAALWGLAIIFFGLSANMWIALFFLACAGAADMVSVIFRFSIWNETIPNHLRGRLAGVEMISYLSGPMLGNAEAGLLAAALGTTFSVLSGGVACVLGVTICAYFLPGFYTYDKRKFTPLST